MDSRTILDSNIWVASMIKEEIDFKNSLKIITELDKVIMPDFILQEIMTVLKVKKHYKLCLDFYKMIKENNSIEIIKIDLHRYDFTRNSFMLIIRSYLSLILACYIYIRAKTLKS